MQHNLTILNLHKNRISELPSDIFKPCASLMELRLDENQIKEFHKDLFWSNKKFKMLNIMDNPVKSFDAYYLPSEMELLYIG